MRIAFRLVLTATWLALLTPAAHAEMVQNWKDSANYPARVNAISFGSQRLSASNPVRFGSWTIRLNNNSPITMYYAAREGLVNIYTSEVACTNSVVGTIPCHIGFSATGSLDGKCTAVKNIREGEQWLSFDIPCPSGIDMTR